MPDQSDDIIRQYYEDVPLEDDYLLQVPEIVMMDDQAITDESEIEISSEMRLRKSKKTLEGDVLVVGAGISGMQAALDIADKGYRVIMIEKSATIGGNMVKLDKTFPTNDCSICTSAPKMVEVARHPNINLLTYADLSKLEGEPGNFKARIFRKSKYVDPDKCTGCGDCTPVCPVEIINPFEEKLSKKKAIYIEFPQAVPIVYTIDYDACVGCGSCERFCEPGAISFLEKSEDIEVSVGSVIIATGYELFEPLEMRREYGYGKYPNVITAMQFERLLSSFGPTDGKLKRPSDGEKPKSVAWIQCVGSRSKQLGFPYCSRVCCMYATKEASIAKELDPDMDISVFYMDIRAYGKDFQQYYDKAQNMGVEYIRSRPSSVFQNDDGSITIRYMNTHTREVTEKTVDLLVLSTAIMPSKENKRLAEALDIEIDDSGFFQVKSIMSDPIVTTREGVFLAGCNQGPKDIPDSVAMASGAAAKAVAPIIDRVKAVPVPDPPQKQVVGEKPRIGVFVCHCGKNIHGYLDTEEVARYAEAIPGVVYSKDIMFACSEDTQKDIRENIKDLDLNRVIIAACSPITHGGLFEDTLIEAGLNKYLFEFVNIRQHCSWVHSHDNATATQKAKDLVRMSISKSKLLEPLSQEEVDVTTGVLIIGGGLAGMRAATALADMKIPSFIIEQESELGGQLRHLHTLFPSDTKASDIVQPLIQQVDDSEYITVYKNSTLDNIEGYIGNFKATIKSPDGEIEIDYGTTIIASGFGEIDMNGKYGYGQSQKIMTQTELEGHIVKDDLSKPNTIVMVNCAGAMDKERPYCCRIGCGVSIKNAKILKEKYPNSDIYILYRDIRVFGKDEEEYFADVIENAGVKIIRYSLEGQPDINIDDVGNVTVKVWDQVYNEEISISTDLLVLTAQTQGDPSVHKLVEMFKVPIGPGNFFIEAHAKIKPLDFATSGVYFCGSAHFPKNLADSIAQAEGAASRAAIPILKGKLTLEGITALVDDARCVGCGLCVEACPYSAIELTDEGKALVNEALCKGCGLCNGTCRSGAIQQKGFNDHQILSMIKSAMFEVI
ncbi:MAG: CoB--CoM heterodisulfide reductase iron-sulfur subunit A family protein [Thermoplasmata archaeon]|nr:CoB--CoM heterodisulfide reductase iron-sulfur subunit A family protein [Thermoplasmata archaeon]